MTTETTTDDRPNIHTWMGLSYSDYLVLHRTLLQSMPEKWQRDFTTMLDEFHEAFLHVDRPECFKVQPAVEREVSDLSDEELKQVGYSKSDDKCDCYAYIDEGSGRLVQVPPRCPHEVDFYDASGNEVSPDHVVLWPVDQDPVPHYNRGRTHIEPVM
jgi:hypothetical protein